jgi:alkanesulfonate monooxygenase SsuD/methylene tetrahydromethanopterin reductase-like flavin-dependent oxidoreductase (luciferase family)
MVASEKMAGLLDSAHLVYHTVTPMSPQGHHHPILPAGASSRGIVL